MNDKCLHTLEYDKIINILCDYASSELGKVLVKSQKPMTDINEIVKAQGQTSTALSMIWKKGSISFSGLHDIRPSLKRLEIGSVLGIGELLRISALLNVTLKIKNYGYSPDEEVSNCLTGFFENLEPLSPFNNEIKKCIISEEEISDEASPTLKSIRRQIKITNDKIHSDLTSMVSGSARTYLQDAVITMRNGRYCVPVKQEYRSNVPGMIHDQSSSGSTIFVEPMAIVKLNNELKELSIKEQDEIEIILAGLSEQAATHIEEMHNNLDILTKLDFIFAKAAFSKAYKCSEPVFNNDRIINIKCGRHPLLDAGKVVPINIHLGDEFNQLVITGPNTGGKTVSLKTVGLFTLMGQAGMHIPADEGSTLSVFNEVFADIGDEQSIEQSLSTFSSHMTNIVKILDKADDRSLVLFDELCAGTDPTEGAALAVSILTFLHNMKVRTMATTHYSEIKLYALSTQGVQNACCEFDVNTLSPTYRLLIGIPGKSNAFAISGKLGLPEFIIDDAKKRIDEDDLAFEDIISELETNKLKLDEDKTALATLQNEVEALKKQLEAEREKLNDRREGIINQANEKAQEILQNAKDYADETIRKVTKLGKSSSTKELENERRKLRERIDKTQTKKTLGDKVAKAPAHNKKDFKIGDRVRVLSMGTEGTVSTLPNDKGDLFVQMGILRSQVNIRDLIIIDEPVITSDKLTRTGSGKIKMSKSFSISTEINLIGMTTDEAIAELDKYLDDAYLSHLPSVRIVHGKGTGALRSAVQNHLKRCKYIKSYRNGAYGEGEAGVTIAEFK